MRLTVGPLPAAVYWRRRAVVLVGLAMIVLVISYACGDPTSGAGVTAGPSPSSPGPTPTTTLLRPEVPSPSATSPTTPSPSAYTLPAPAVTGACTDAEMEVTAAAGAAEVPKGQPLAVTIKIKNISTRTCSRDIGADMQELRLNDAATTIWSSDDCGANQGHDDRSFDPGQEAVFTLTWTGRRSRGGTGAVQCDAVAPDAGVYQLVARLDQKLSAPFEVRVVA